MPLVHPPAKYTVPLSRKEITALAALAQQGNEKAVERIALSHYRFLVRTAGKYIGRGVPVEDLVSEGMIGLLHAARTYQAERGVSFGSYGVWWIRHSLTTLIQNQSLSIRVPANFYLKGEGPNGGYDRKRGVPVEERKAKNEKRIARNQETIRAIRGSSPLRLDGDYGNALISKEPGPDATVIDWSNKKRVAGVLKHLDPRDAEIISRYYGIGRPAEGLQSIGDSMDISKERVRQLKINSLKALKYRFSQEEL